ncbi:hypothetical protein [Leptospira levettii]|uniref:hypothetical protein n=1 Tax=Leptospira levettii TaxID=2023178 RepID=UPI0010827479|nr:hypothetical protein [Leptospira levettii]TGL05052.1 hypothetical protein EHQ39_14950 [Leptospira levettii]
MKTLIHKFSFLLLSFWMVFGCKPSYTKQLDKILEEGNIFQSAIFCEQNKVHLKEREFECIEVTKKAKDEIDSIINRRLDLGIAPVIIEKSKGKEIEEFLKVHTQMGIRYWEIWKSSVILE